MVAQPGVAPEPSSGSLIPKGQGRAPTRGFRDFSFVTEVDRHSIMLECGGDHTPLAILKTNLSPSLCVGEEDSWNLSGLHLDIRAHTHTEEGNYLMLLLIRLSLAQEEAEQGACHFKRGSLLGKLLADTMTSFLPPVA